MTTRLILIIIGIMRVYINIYYRELLLYNGDIWIGVFNMASDISILFVELGHPMASHGIPTSLPRYITAVEPSMMVRTKTRAVKPAPRAVAPSAHLLLHVAGDSTDDY